MNSNRYRDGEDEEAYASLKQGRVYDTSKKINEKFGSV